MTITPDTSLDADETVARLHGERPEDPGQELDAQLHLARLRQQFGVAASSVVPLGKWDVERKLGHGGMGAVYLASDRSLGRPVALKLLVAGTDRQDRVREARALAAISDRNVVQVYSVDDSRPPAVVIEMEYVEGITLRVWQAEPGRDWKSIVAAYAAAAGGLAAIHRAGLVHRDIKPDNILVSTSGEVKIADLGLAVAPRALPGSDTRPTSAPLPPSALTVHATAEGALVGTLGYIAPEVLAGHEATAHSDQFSFASSLFEAVFGGLPFRGATPEAQAAAIRDGVLTLPKHHPAPRWLLDALRKALACAPQKRHPTMEALSRVLHRGLGRRRRWTLIALIGGALAATSWTAWALKPLPADPCVDAGAPMAVVLSNERRDALGHASRSASDPRLRRATDLLADTVERRARRWRDTSVQLCYAEHRAPPPDPLLLEVNFRQRACLDQLLRSIDLLLSIPIATESIHISRLYETAEALEALPSCEDRRALMHWPIGVTDDSKVVEQLTHSQALEIASDYLAAEQLARAVASRPSILPFRRAQALYQLGHILGSQHLFTAASTILDDARDLAALAGNHALMCRTAVYQAKLAANVAMDPLASARELRLAEQCALWDDTAPLRTADLFEARGLLAFAVGEFENARNWHGRALDLRRDLLGLDHPDVAKSFHNLANTLAELADPAAARHFAAALEIRERIFGSDHPDVADILVDQSAAQAPPAARASLTRALAIFERTPGRHHAARANIHIALANFDRAAAPASAAQHIARARELQDQASELPPHHPDRALLDLHEGALALDQGEFRRARIHLTRAIARYRRHEPDGPGVLNTVPLWVEAVAGQQDFLAIASEVRDLGDPLRAHLRALPPTDAGKFAWYLAEAFLRDNSPAEAASYLRVALAAYEQLDEPGHVAELRWTLARTLVDAEADRQEAIRLAGAALTFYQQHGPRAQSTTITRWLADTSQRPALNEP